MNTVLDQGQTLGEKKQLEATEKNYEKDKIRIVRDHRRKQSRESKCFQIQLSIRITAELEKIPYQASQQRYKVPQKILQYTTELQANFKNKISNTLKGCHIPVR